MLNLYIVMLTYVKAMVNISGRRVHTAHLYQTMLNHNTFVQIYLWERIISGLIWTTLILRKLRKTTSNRKLKIKLLSWIKQNIIREKETLDSKRMQQGTHPQATKCWIIFFCGLHLCPLVLIYPLMLIFASALMYTTSGRVMAEPGTYLQVIYWHTSHLWITYFDPHTVFFTFF